MKHKLKLSIIILVMMVIVLALAGCNADPETLYDFTDDSGNLWDGRHITIEFPCSLIDDTVAGKTEIEWDASSREWVLYGVYFYGGCDGGIEEDTFTLYMERYTRAYMLTAPSIEEVYDLPPTPES